VIEEQDSKSVNLLAELARATDTIAAFTREFSFEFEAVAELSFKKERPIEEIMKLHRAMTEFCSTAFSVAQARLLRTALEKGLNTSPDLAARLLAEQIHAEFIRNRKTESSTFDQLIAVFRMLNAKSVFEAYHHLLLSRRVLMLKRHIVAADETFLAELTAQCGPEYVKRFNTLIDDLHKSVEVLEKFPPPPRSPPRFHALVLSKQAWPTVEPIRVPAPPGVQHTLAAFTEFYQGQIPKRRLQWSLEFTRVKLLARNTSPPREIRCSGIAAVLLLAFNRSPVMSLAEIAHATGLDPALVEEIAHVLTSKRGGRLLIGLHQKFRVNGDAALQGPVTVPFAFPTLPKVEDSGKSTIDTNRGSQIDAAAMLVMKQEKSMEKAELKRRIKEIISFRLDEELFEKRMAHLAQILYLKLDPSGRVHYLP
jgi:hypothetical protein